MGYVLNPFTNYAEFNYTLFYNNNYEAMRLMDNLVDLEIEYVDRIIAKINSDPELLKEKAIELDTWKNLREMGIKGRRTGLGITALGDCLAALGLKYDSEDALKVIEKIFHTKMRSELDCTIDLAVLRGHFSGWDINKEYSSINDMEAICGNNKFYDSLLDMGFELQVLRMLKYGRRNVSFSTVAPTGSVSLLANNCTGGIEPLFSPYYFRRKKVNPGENGVRVDFVDQNGDSWTEFPVLHPYFKQWILEFTNSTNVDFTLISKEDLQKWFVKSPWYGSTANDIDWVKRVEIQGVIQKYISHSIKICAYIK